MQQREHDPSGEGGPPPGEPAGGTRPRPQPRRGAGGPPGSAGGGSEPFLDRRALVILGIGALAGLLTRLACSGP